MHTFRHTSLFLSFTHRPALFSRTAALAAFLVAGLAAMTPAQAQLVTNGDFETGDFTGWTLSGAVNLGASDDTFVFGAPHTGDYAAWLGAPSGGVLSQDIATTAGHKYDISYYLSVDTYNSLSTPNNFQSSFGPATLFSATDLAATDGHADSADDYTLYTFTAVASGPTSALTFGFGNANAEFRLDDVAVTDAGPVPEASTTVSLGLLLALGLGTTVAASRKTSAAKKRTPQA